MFFDSMNLLLSLHLIGVLTIFAEDECLEQREFLIRQLAFVKAYGVVVDQLRQVSGEVA